MPAARTNAERMVRAAVFYAAVALFALLTPSPAAAVPFEKHGTLAVAKSGSQGPIRVTYEGPFPKMRSNDIVSYVLLYNDEGGPQPRNCNKYPPGSGRPGDPERRKHRRAAFSAFVDADSGGDPPTRWCPGRWTAVAYVLRRRHGYGYTPRLMYAKKRFSIG